MEDNPFISVVIPMRNEAGWIEACLGSILAQDYPRDRFEVIVVDGESNDGSARILAGYGEQIRVLSNPGRIVPTAMNIGIRAARGEVIARVDAHTVLQPSYLREGVEALRRSGAENVGGPMISVGGGKQGDAIAAAMGSRFGIGAYFHFGTEDREVDTVYMGMYPRRVFERIGLFDEELVRNQDDELNYRLRKAGGRVFMTPRMQSRYQNRQSIRALARQFFQYGEWKVRVLQKHPLQMSWRHFVPPTLVFSLALLLALSPWMRAAGILLGVEVIAYAAAVLGATAGAARGRDPGFKLRLALAFVTMHLSWGSGFLAGMIRFGRHWLADESAPPRLGSVTSNEFNESQPHSARGSL
jgi:glycosyltransferase involved in cell wall biosynthesis